MPWPFRITYSDTRSGDASLLHAPGGTARIEGRDHGAHRLLVEAFEAAAPLQVLEVASDHPLAPEELGLLRGD